MEISLTGTILDTIAENWPALVYILVATGFSIRFLQERRAETRLVRELGENLRSEITSRLDRIEYHLRHGPIPGEDGESVRKGSVQYAVTAED